MVYIPWRRIGSWSCSRCGLCCGFNVILRPFERDGLLASLGERAIGGNRSRPTVKRRDGVCVFRRPDGDKFRCLLQDTGLKPSACRTFPFLTSPEPLRLRTAGESRYQFGERHLYIYANSACPSLRMGRPSAELEQRVLPEVAEISFFGREDQVATTGR